MSKARSDKAKRRPSGITLGLAAFEKISAVEGIRLTPEMRRDLLAFEQQGLNSEERTRFISEKYGLRSS